MDSNTQFLSRSIRMFGILIFCFGIHLFFIPILLGAFFSRVLVAILAKSFRPDLDSFVTGADLGLLSSSTQQAASNLILSTVLNGNVSENLIQEMYHERLLKQKDSKGNMVYKKLFQFWTPFLGYAFWKTDRSFSLSNHVRNYDYEDVNLPKPRDETSLKEVMAQLLTLPWKPNQSHWEVLLVSEYKWELGPDTHDRYSLVIVRGDHSIADAISSIKLAEVILQVPMARPNASRNAKQISLWDKYKSMYFFPYEASKLFPVFLRGRCLEKLDPSKPYVFDASERIPVSTIKKIKDTYGVDYSPVLHSAINAGICRTLETLKKIPPKCIDLLTTLPMPDHPGGTSNHARAFVTELPLKSASSLDRLIVTHKILRKCGGDGRSMASIHFLKLIQNFPVTIVRRIASSTFTAGPSYNLSIIPTISSRVFIDNFEVVDVYFTYGVSWSVGMNIAVGGINNQQRIHFSYTPNIFGSEITQGTLSKFVTQEINDLAANLS